MTESRDQQFFDQLSGGRGDEDGDPEATTPTTTSAGGVAPPTAPAPAPNGFAADENDPVPGRHHVDPPVGDTGGAWGQPTGGGWPQPHQQSEPPAPPWTPSPEVGRGAEASPPDIAPQSMGGAPQSMNQAPQGFPTPQGEPTVPPRSAPTPLTEETAQEQGELAGPPRTAEQGSAPSPRAPLRENPYQSSAMPWPPAGNADPQGAPLTRPAPRPVPPTERTQFIPRELVREAQSRSTPPPPPPGWPAQGGGRPTSGRRPVGPPAPGWPAPESTRPQLPAEPSAPAGPRPPDWNWDQGGGGTGGAELRSEQISASELIAPKKIPSSRGWRKWLYYGTFKLVNTGESPDEQLVRNLSSTVAGHLRGTYSIAVLGGKGGVGKTTTTAAVGSTFAALRKDKTVAIDANPDRASNLADRIDPSATNSYKEVLSDPNLQRYTDIRSHVGMNSAGLDVLGNRYQSDRPPLTAEIYTQTHDTLQLFYSVLISDSGTDVDHAVIPGLMGRADALIMVASTAPDGAKGAAELMDWAYEAGYHRLLQRTVVVINDVRGEDGKSHRKMVDSLVEKFSRWVSQQRVFVVPFDPHIASAGVIDVNQLRPETRRRYLEITAQVASGFNSSEDSK